jgi:uncharacterized protein DUF4333
VGNGGDSLRTVRTVLAAFALAGATSVAAGCGGGSDDGAQQKGTGTTTQAERSVDVKQLEDQLKPVLSRGPQAAIEVPGQATPAAPAQPGFEVKSVSCPEEIQPKKGQRFECKVDAGKDGSGTVDLTQTDAEGKEFKYRSKQKQAGVTTTTKGTLVLDGAAGTPAPAETPTTPAPPPGGSDGGTSTYDLDNPRDVEEACKRLPEGCKTYPK